MKHIKEKTLCTKDYKIHDRAWTLLTGCPSADELDGLEVGRDELGAVGGGPDGYRTQCVYEVLPDEFLQSIPSCHPLMKMARGQQTWGRNRLRSEEVQTDTELSAFMKFSQMNFFRVGYSELSSTNEDGKGTADLGSKPASVGGGPDGDRTQCLGYMKV